MKKLLLMFVCVLCAVHGVSAIAADFSYTGNFAGDDDVQLFNFTVGATSTVTLVTHSYAGGTMADGTVIPAGGFDPILALFDGAGELIDQNDDGAGVPADPITDNEWDTLLVAVLAPGNYTVAVTQYDNYAIGPNLSNGFNGSDTLDFEDASGDFRNNFWAFDILNVDSAQVIAPTHASPIPTLSQWSTLLLVLTLALSGFLASRRRNVI